MDDQLDAEDAFALELRDASFEHDGPVAELRTKWAPLAPARATRPALIVALYVMAWLGGVAVMGVLLLSIFDERLGLDLLTIWGWPLGALAAVGALARGAAWLYERPDAGLVLDRRKRGLVDALVAYLERMLPPTARVHLTVDFRSARRHARAPVVDGRFDFGDLALPDSEPAVHDWLFLTAQVGERELAMRVRSLFGTMGEELRIRDEVGVELRGEGLATELRREPPAELVTRLVAHDLQPQHTRLQFRGAGAGRQRPVDPNRDLGVLDALGSRNLIEPIEVEHHDLEWLLGGDDLVAHVEYALALDGS